MKFKLPSIIVLAITAAACAETRNAPPLALATGLNHSGENHWYRQGAQKVEELNRRKLASERGAAKNVIVFIGDGMGISTVTAARILEGQLRGETGEENWLSFERFPYVGLSKTYNTDQQIPDSAGTMTAIVTGVKTDAGTLGVDQNIERGDCASVAGNELNTALELAEVAGLATGIVTTARLTHATPAANYAKSAERNWEDISDMPREALQAGCKDIALQFIESQQTLAQRFPSANIDGIDVAMGGGRRHFLPKDRSFNSPDAVSEIEGDRSDGRNLINEWQQLYPTGSYIFDQKSFDALTAPSTGPVLGLFNEAHMRYSADRKNDIAGEPSLAEMTNKAIDLLKQKNKGYFLVVEGGRIDHGHHAGSAYNALTDTIAFADAVALAADKTSADDTLILVTADHSHVFTIAGYASRGNPILGLSAQNGKPMLDSEKKPYTTLGYQNGRGMQNLGEVTDADEAYRHDINHGRKDISGIDTQAPGFHQEALVGMKAETHGGEDVGIYARGPGAHLVSGVLEQNVIFHIIEHALGLTNKGLTNKKTDSN